MSPSSSSTGPPFDHDFDRQPWCVALDEDPAWKLVPSFSFEARTKSSTECSLISDSLKNSRGIRAMRTYLRSTNDGVPREVHMLFSLGDGVCGIADTCHGGLIGLMLDEATGHLAAEVFGRHSIITAALSLSYKRRLNIPAIVVCKAWLPPGNQVRKARAQGSIEDGNGVVYATGEALFVRIGHKM